MRKAGSGRWPVRKRSGVGGDENHRNFERTKKLIHRVKARTAVGQLNVRQNKPGPLLVGEGDSLTMRAGDADDLVAEAFNQRLDIHRDEGLVLDNENVGRDLGGKLATGFLDQAPQRRQVALQNLRRVIFRKAFQGHQQERLAGPRRDLRQMLFRRAGSVRQISALPFSGTEFQILVNSR